jgi:colanic acid/amylovoran biosynthesis glycosyltransferase
MKSKRMKILTVLHRAPVNSVFLADKYVRLSQEMNMHMLVWDTDDNISAFAHQSGVSKSRIHNGIQNQWQALAKIGSIISVILFNRQARKYLLNDKASLLKKLKLILSYLPVFSVKPNIIHFEFGTLATHIADLKKITRAKICVSFRGYDINYVGLNDKDYYKNVWQYADGFHFLGNDLKQRAIKRGYNNDKTEALIPAAIDTNYFTNNERQHNTNGPLNIYSIGRLTWKKGFEYALQALAILKQHSIPFHYHLIGSGTHEQAIQFTIAELGLEQHVTIHGSKNREYIKQALQQADLFIQPSISEGFCNAALEAQAMAVPVIATDADGLPENIADGMTGYIVPKWNAAAIVEKLIWFHYNREALQQMGKKGAERVRKHFDIEDQINAFIAFYKKLHDT